jgi:DNA-binding SARP family transcriptional activator
VDLWLNIDYKKARHHLRVDLTHLRKIIKDEQYHFLKLDKESIVFSGIISCDLTLFFQRILQAVNEKDPAVKRERCASLLAEMTPDPFRL